MPSALYVLLDKAFGTLSVGQWAREIAANRLVLTDPNEKNLSGTLLHVVARQLSAACHGQNWKADADDGRFQADADAEALLLLLLERGARPWVPCGGPTGQQCLWDVALLAGWTKVMAALLTSPDAPSKSALAARLQYSSWSSKVAEWALAGFAKRNQHRELEAWAGLGLSLAPPQGLPKTARHPLQEALTPEFIQSWFRSGGGSDGLGEADVVRSWSSHPAALQVRLLKAWRTQFPAQADPRSLSVRMDELFRASLDKKDARLETKTMFAQAMRDMGLTWRSTDENGRTLAEAWAAGFIKSPRSIGVAIGETFFGLLPRPRQQEVLAVALLELGPRPSRDFPSVDLLTSWLSAGGGDRIVPEASQLALAAFENSDAQVLIWDAVGSALLRQTPCSPGDRGEYGKAKALAANAMSAWLSELDAHAVEGRTSWDAIARWALGERRKVEGGLGPRGPMPQAIAALPPAKQAEGSLLLALLPLTLQARGTPSERMAAGLAWLGPVPFSGQATPALLETTEFFKAQILQDEEFCRKVGPPDQWAQVFVSLRQAYLDLNMPSASSDRSRPRM